MTNLSSNRQLLCLALAIISMLVAEANAQQQKYATAYVGWKFDNPQVTNFDQEVIIGKTAPGTQWVMQFDWIAQPGKGGYFGFNTGGANGATQVLFSLWDANGKDGDNCREFGGEGTGLSCRLPYTLAPNKFYRLHVERDETDQLGVWWSASVIEGIETGTHVEHRVGRLRVPKTWNTIDGNSMSNFSEYWGPVVPKCNQVPVSVQIVMGPRANYDHTTNQYTNQGNFDPKSAQTHDKNLCKTGNESEGALMMRHEMIAMIQYRTVPLSSVTYHGVFMFLGGTTGLDPYMTNIGTYYGASVPYATIIMFNQ